MVEKEVARVKLFAVRSKFSHGLGQKISRGSTKTGCGMVKKLEAVVKTLVKSVKKLKATVKKPVAAVAKLVARWSKN